MFPQIESHFFLVRKKEKYGKNFQNRKKKNITKIKEKRTIIP
jgi:hypothetical protein